MRHEYSSAYGRVILRPLKLEDAETLRVLRNQNRDKFVSTAEITAEAQSAWYSRYLERAGDYMFSVYDQRSSQWVGAVGIYDVDVKTGLAEFGRLLIGREFIPERGLGTDATRAACKFAFDQLGLKELRLEVYHNNVPALVTYLKSGFLPYALEAVEDGRRLVHMSAFSK